MSSGGGGTTTIQEASTELPSWLQNAAQSNLGRADVVSKIGYVPNYGLDVAGFTPMQTAAMQNTADAASAFGLSAPTDAMAGMPQTTTNNLGFTGYSSGNLYDAALEQLAANRPAQYATQQSMFVDPLTGDLPLSFGSGGNIDYNADAVMSVPTWQGYATPTQVESVFNPVTDGSNNYDPNDPYAEANKYNKAQSFLSYMKQQQDNPLLGTSLLAQGAKKLAESYMDSEAGMNASQGGSILTYDPVTYPTSRTISTGNYSTPVSNGGWGSNLSDVQSAIDSSGYGYDYY